MKEYIDVLKKWKDFDGRARRREYWMFVLFMAIFAIVASIIDAILYFTCMSMIHFELIYVKGVRSINRCSFCMWVSSCFGTI